jgi:hypothetical protein
MGMDWAEVEPHCWLYVLLKGYNGQDSTGKSKPGCMDVTLGESCWVV